MGGLNDAALYVSLPEQVNIAPEKQGNSLKHDMKTSTKHPVPEGQDCLKTSSFSSETKKHNQHEQKTMQTLQDLLMELPTEPKKVLTKTHVKGSDFVPSAPPSTPEAKEVSHSLKSVPDLRQHIEDTLQTAGPEILKRLKDKVRDSTRQGVTGSHDILPTPHEQLIRTTSKLSALERIRRQQNAGVGSPQRKVSKQPLKQKAKFPMPGDPVRGLKLPGSESGQGNSRAVPSSSSEYMYRPSPPFMNRTPGYSTYMTEGVRKVVPSERQVRAFQSKLEELDMSVQSLAFMNNGDKEMAKMDVEEKQVDLNDHRLIFDDMIETQAVSTINTLARICNRLAFLDMPIRLSKVLTKCVSILGKNAKKNEKYTWTDDAIEIPYDVEYGLPSELRGFVTNIIDSDFDCESAKKEGGFGSNPEILNGETAKKKTDRKEASISEGYGADAKSINLKEKKPKIEEDDSGNHDSRVVRASKIKEADYQQLLADHYALKEEHEKLYSTYLTLEKQLESAIAGEQPAETFLTMSNTSKPKECQAFYHKNDGLDTSSVSEDDIEIIESSDLGGSYLSICAPAGSKKPASSLDKRPAPSKAHGGSTIAPVPSTIPIWTKANGAKHRPEPDRISSDGKVPKISSILARQALQLELQQAQQSQQQQRQMTQRPPLSYTKADAQAWVALQAEQSTRLRQQCQQSDFGSGQQKPDMAHQEEAQFSGQTHLRRSTATRTLNLGVRDEGRRNVDRWLEKAYDAGLNKVSSETGSKEKESAT